LDREREPRGDVKKSMIHAARELFASKGYAETSVQEIVEAAGVTKGAFYYYFSSKDEVLELIHDEFLDYEISLVEELEKYGGTAPERLGSLVRDLIRSIIIYRENVRVFFQEFDRLPEPRKAEIEKRRRVYQQHVEDIVRDGVRQGSFRSDLDPTVATLGIFGLANYTYRWIRSDGRLPADAVIDMLAQMAVGAVKKPVAPPTEA